MKTLTLFTAIILTASMLFGQIANYEQQFSSNSDQQGWTREGYDLGWSYQYPYDTDTLIQNTPFGVDWSINAENPLVLTGDVNGDGLIEIIYTSNNMLHVLDRDGSELWSITLNFIDGGVRNILDDVTGDGIYEIIIGTRINSTLKLLVYDGSGNLIKEITENEEVNPDNHIHARTVLDIDNDGDLEVVAFRYSGYELWSRGVEVFDYKSGDRDWFYSIGPGPLSLNVADITGDQNKEIIIGTGGPANGHNVNGFADNRCYAICWDKDGNLLWSRQFEGSGFVDSEVSVKDLDGDGKNEVIYTSRAHGWQWWDGNLGGIYLLNPDNGEIIKEYNAGNPLIVNGIADISGDDKKEILVNYQDGSTQTGKILMFDDSLNLLQEYVVPGSVLRVCTINDLNGDGHLEIIVYKMMANEFVVLDENFNELWSLSFPDEVKDVIPSDLDKDGINELIVSTSQNLHVLNATADPTVTMVSPNGGEFLEYNTLQSINWTSTSILVENVNIWLSYNGGLSYDDLLFENITNDGEELWTVPEAQCNTARIKTEGFDAEGLLVAEDESNGDFFIYTTPPVSLDSGLVAYYPFSGNTDDESENDNHGTVYGATLSTDRFGEPDKSYSFDGIDDYISVEDDESLRPTSLTISCFAKLDFPIEYATRHLVTKNFDFSTNLESYCILFDYDQTIGSVICDFNGYGNRLNTPHNPGDNQWHHILFKFDDSKDSVWQYIDRQLVAKGLELKSISYDEALLTISANNEWGNLDYFFQGKIDDVRIYDRALNEFEIQALYHEGDWKIKPSFMTELDDQAVCKNDSIAFEAIAVGITPINYQWQKDSIDIPGATDSILIIPQVQPEDGGEYRCIATNEHGTGSSNPATLSVEFANPTKIMGFTSVHEYQVGTYSVDIQEGHTYEFIVAGGNVIDGTENSVTVHWSTPGQGFINLIEMSELGCFADTNTLDVTIGYLGIEDHETNNLSVFPNPFITSTTIEFELTEPGEVELKIYNQFGKQVDMIEESQQKGINRIVWTPENLADGIYYFKFKAGEQVASGKVILMR